MATHTAGWSERTARSRQRLPPASAGIRVNTTVGVSQERRGAVAALRSLTTPIATVLRDGESHRLPTTDLLWTGVACFAYFAYHPVAAMVLGGLFALSFVVGFGLRRRELQ